MRAGAQRRGLAVVVVAACLIQAAPAAAPQSAGVPTSKGVLEDWDQSELTLRQAVWRLYEGTAAFGKDIRGRTLDDDLKEWIMTSDVRIQLRLSRDKAEHQQQAGDPNGAQATWSYAKKILDEQSKRLAVVNLYWSQRITVERLRALWLTWVGRAPEDVAKSSKDRINSLVNQLTTDFAPTDNFNVVWKEITQLKIAYDVERQKLAALVSAREVAAGEVVGSLDRSVPCIHASAVGRADPDKQGRSDAASRSAKLLDSPSAEQLYPSDARHDSISGDVILQVTVGPDGCMKHVEVASSSGAPELDESAMQLSEYATFRPAEGAGQPVEGSLKVKYHFTLNDDSYPAKSQTKLSDDGAAVHVDRGNKFMDRGAYDEAIAELDEAIGLDPGNATAFADRGLAYMWKGEAERARVDFEQAYALDPHNFVVFHGRGMLALRAGNALDAIAAFTQALFERQRDSFALRWRGEAYLLTGDLDRAARDEAEMIRINPAEIDAYFREATILRALHKPDEALQQAEAVMAANPNNASATLSAGYIYAASGRPDDALHAFDRATELDKSGVAYLARARHRPRADLAGRRADIEAALKLDPNSDNATILLADLESETGDSAAALATLNTALTARSDDVNLLTRRAIAYLKQHQDSLAQEDLGKVGERAKGNPRLLNALCWSLATADVALAKALQACNEAVAGDPENPAILDSLGFVLLESGHYAEALAAYNQALARRALAPTSLYGRGLAKRRQGDSAGGADDVATASMLDARAAETFASYGPQ